MVEVEDYKLLSALGEGIQGQVYVAENKNDNKLYALKFIDRFYKDQQKEEQVILMLEQEVNAIEMVVSDRVIKSTECFTTENFFVIVMEYCKNGDLFEYIKEKKFLQEQEAFELFAQILDGIKAVHAQNLIHRDIKPENLLLDDNFSIKIGDFGASILYDKELLHENLCGTFYYMAPELENYSDYDFSVDMWSIGCVLFFMLTGKSPFSFCNSQLSITNTISELCQPQLNVDKLIQQHIQKNSLTDENNTILSQESKDLISKMLSYKPEDRISFIDILKHPAFKKFKKTCPSVYKLINQEKAYSEIYNLSMIKQISNINNMSQVKKHDFTPHNTKAIYLNASINNVTPFMDINSFTNTSANKNQKSLLITQYDIDEVISQQLPSNNEREAGLIRMDSQKISKSEVKNYLSRIYKDQKSPSYKIKLDNSVLEDNNDNILTQSMMTVKSEEMVEDAEFGLKKIENYNSNNLNFLQFKNKITSSDPNTPMTNSPAFSISSNDNELNNKTPQNKYSQQKKLPLSHFCDVSPISTINNKFE